MNRMTKFKKLQNLFMTVIAIFLVLDMVLAGYLLWPGKSGQARQAEEQQLQTRLSTESREIAPLMGIDHKLVETRADIKKFYLQRVPSYWSQLSAELNKLETANGVSEQSIHYSAEETGLPNLQRVEIATGVAGDYLKIAHFINALERDQYLMLIHQISVVGQPAGTVQLQIKLETYLKGAA